MSVSLPGLPLRDVICNFRECWLIRALLLFKASDQLRFVESALNHFHLSVLFRSMSPDNHLKKRQEEL